MIHSKEKSFELNNTVLLRLPNPNKNLSRTDPYEALYYEFCHSNTPHQTRQITYEKFIPLFASVLDNHLSVKQA